MSYGEEVLKLRKKIVDAVNLGVLSEDSKDTFEAVLLQIMNDAERNRQQCASQADNFRKEAAKLDGQSNAFSSVISIVYLKIQENPSF